MKQEGNQGEGKEAEDEHEAEDVAQNRKESRLFGVLAVGQWMPCEASQRSASIAALQPSPAAETACR